MRIFNHLAFCFLYKILADFSLEIKRHLKDLSKSYLKIKTLNGLKIPTLFYLKIDHILKVQGL